MVFNPFIKWFRRGPFSSLYGRYLWGKTPLPTKISASSCVHVHSSMNRRLC